MIFCRELGPQLNLILTRMRGVREWHTREERTLRRGSQRAEPGVRVVLLTLQRRKAFKQWRRIQVDWPAEFPEANLKPPLDVVDDLLPLDVGKLYKKIEASDPERRLYGYLPLMASCSYGQIGALNAESFCERTLRVAGHVMDEGNTLLGDAELEMLTILRMNRAFMEFMRQALS